MSDRPQTLRLSEFLPFQLSVLSNTISRRLADRYEREFGLTIWQWRVMAVLGEVPGLSASEVTRRTAMDKVAVSRAVTALVERGLVRREAAQDDGRRSLLELTADGRRVYERIAPLALASLGEMTSALSADDLKALSGLLDRLARTVSPDSPLW